MNYQKDMDRAITQLSFGSDNMFDKIYSFPTENVKTCLSNYDFKDKNCVSVLGSSFQMIDMYLRGAKNVTAFDINPLSIYYFYFIKAFIDSGIDVEDYVELFHSENSKYINKIYKLISSRLSGLPKRFWDDLFECCGEYIFSNHDLFHYISLKDNDIYNNTLFFDNDKLKYLREHIDILNPYFINCDITSLDKYLKEEYDFIYLSNIMQYSKNIYNTTEKQSLMKFKDLLMKLSKKLKDNGEIYCSYLYDFPNDYYFDFELLKECFNDNGYSYGKFSSYSTDKSKKDGVLIYKK